MPVGLVLASPKWGKFGISAPSDVARGHCCGGSQYGSLVTRAITLVTPVALLFGLGSAFAGLPVPAPIGCSAGMVVLAVVIRQTSRVEGGRHDLVLVP